MLRGLAGIFERRQMSSRKFAHPGRHSASRGPHTELGGGRDGERHAPLGTDTDEVSEQLVRTGTPPSADLTPEHHELLRAAVQFGVGSSLSVLRDPQGGSVVCSSAVLRQTCACQRRHSCVAS